MTSYLWLTFITFALALCASCQARARSPDDERELIKILSTEDDFDTETSQRHIDYTAGQTQNTPLYGAPAAPSQSIWYRHLVNDLLADERLQLAEEEMPSGYQGTRGKRFIPGLQSLLLASYYQDAKKWKRQPHKGYHAGRG